MKTIDVTVIGLGALGSVLVPALRESGLTVKSVYNRTPTKAKATAGKWDIPIFGSFPAKADDLGNLIFLTVSDSSISEAAMKLDWITDDFSNKIIVHCSGNESSDLLGSLSNKGASTAAFHPLQSFTQSSKPEDFRNIYFSLEGDEKAKNILEEITQSFGAQCINVSKKGKSCLHAAAVMASNYLVALTGASADIGSLGNLDEDELKEALLPLMQTTLRNIAGNPLSGALSGPIARGDVQTVEKHLELLKAKRELFNLYKMLGKQTLKIAENKESLDKSAIASLRSLLNE